MACCCRKGFAQHRFSSWKSGAGFTIFELLTVIALIVILAVIFYPNFKDYLQDQDLKNSTVAFIGNLKLAQQYTVTEQIKYAIKASLQSDNYTLVKKTEPEIITGNFTLGSNIYFSATGGLINNEAVFNPTGAVDFSGEIFLTHQTSGKRTKIYIKPSGYVTWEIL